MTTQESFINDNKTEFLYHSIWENFKFTDNIFEKLLPIVNDNDKFIEILFELVGFDITMNFDGLMYSALLEAFTVEVERNSQILDKPRELIALRYADRIKEAIKKYTPEYYKFVCSIDYYDYRLLPIIVEGTNNHREIIETVLRDKAIRVIADFIELVFPEVDNIVEKLDDELIAFIMPSILEYNRTTVADKEVVMRMIINPEALFTLKTENSEMSNVIVQTLLEQVEKKRNQSEESCDGSK